jgi:hypothetical protein
VSEEFLSRKRARDVYGVVILDDGSLETDETSRLRAASE